MIVVELLQRLDQQVVDREPDRSTPVRVAAEEIRRRLGGLVADFVPRAIYLQLVRLVAVLGRDGANAEGRQELAFVEHDLEHASEAIRVENCQQPPLTV